MKLYVLILQEVNRKYFMKSKELEVLDNFLPANREEDIDSDYEYTRDNLKELINNTTSFRFNVSNVKD